jgi:uncharacterized membrane protein YphA (DoxX/SURF4 family)
MKKVTLIIRLLLGLVFFASGVSFFLTKPPAMTGAIAVFFNGLMATHYFFYLLKGCETVCGLLLLSGRFVPLALVTLAPIILNIILVNAFMMPNMLPLALGIGVLEIYLAFFSQEYRSPIRALFRPK